MPLKNPDKVGSKINRSRYVNNVVDWLHDGMAMNKCIEQLRERFGFKVSVPVMSGFKKNFYPKRLAQRKKEANKFQEKQVSRVQTYIDEANSQARALKSAINSISEHIQILEEDIKFSAKFNDLFRSSIDRFVDDFDPKNPHRLFDYDDKERMSAEEKAVTEIKECLLDDDRSLSTYIATHSPQNSVKVISQLHKQLLDHRVAIEKIYKNIFNSYRNYSIMQEITVIFEKYNAIIIEEFFSDKDAIDKDKYNRVRKRIFSLFNELQVRYQGYDGPISEVNGKSVASEGIAVNEVRGSGDDNEKIVKEIIKKFSDRVTLEPKKVSKDVADLNKGQK